MTDHVAGRARRLCVAVFGGALIGSLLGLAPPAASGAPVTAGYRDFSYSGASAPTGQKPQSKLWFADGAWWGDLYNSSTHTFRIYRLDWATQTWSDTGTQLDTRSNASGDMKWDGTHLYEVSAAYSTSASASAKVWRYSYDSGSKKYTQDSGFPVTVSSGGAEAVVLDKDTAGVVWVTFTQGGKVYVTHTTINDTTWTAPYVIPVPGAANLTSDDISSIVAFDNQIGVMWSNQNDSAMYWATHADGADDSAWVLNPAVKSPAYADDHLNLKQLTADATGRVFAVTKTSLNDAGCGSGCPLILLLVLKPNGTWQRNTVSRVQENETRATLLLDSEHRMIYVFAAAPCCSGGIIYMKSSSMDNISFVQGLGAPFIQSSTDTTINNPSSTKQNLNGSTGLVVIAGDDHSHFYLHNSMSFGSPDTSPPDTLIDSGPTGTVSSSSASFTFHASEPNSTFACSLDGAAYAGCVSGVTYSGLANGSHTFAVRATDQAGNTDPSPAVQGWTVSIVTGTGIVRGSVSTAVNTTAASTVTVAAPGGTAAGDVLVACLALNGGLVAASGVPAGWSPIAAVTGIANPHVYGYYHVAGASEPSSYTWTLASSVQAGAGIARYSGVDNSNPLDGSATSATGAATTSATVPGVTTASADAMLVGCIGMNSSNLTVTIGGPAGMVEAWDVGGKRTELDDGLQAVAGPSGAKTWTFSAGREWAGWLAALRPR
jgi:hypothetical protein